MNRELLQDIKAHWLVALAIPVLIVASVYMRWTYYSVASGDIDMFVIPWTQHIREQGLLNAYGTAFSNYMPLYMYMLGIGDGLMSGFSIPIPMIIKNISVLGDICCAYLATRLSGYTGPVVMICMVGGFCVVSLPYGDCKQ
jgi:Gpi18-like mannosyltransferase